MTLMVVGVSMATVVSTNGADVKFANQERPKSVDERLTSLLQSVHR